MIITRGMKKILYVVSVVLIFGAGMIVASVWDLPENVSAVSTEKSPDEGTQGVVSFTSFVDIVKKEKPSVVNISTTRIMKRRAYGRNHQAPVDPFRDFFGDDFFKRFFDQRPEREYKTNSLGSGFIISKDGYILTNNHVIENADEIIVRLTDEREFKAEIIGRDAKTDVALIKIKDHDDLPVVTMGDSDSLEVGEWVIAIGNPFGVGQTVTAGIVSAKGREIGAGPYDDFIQTDASINPGNSGGPLFNIKGEVVGINTAIYSPSGGNVGIGFATPINIVKRLIPQLKEKGSVTRAWLGVVIQPISKELAHTFDLPSEEGALVADVIKGSPAEKAGIKRGDVIIEFDKEKIGKMRELPSVVASTPVGKKIRVKIIRDGKVKTLSARVDKLEGDQKAEEPAEEETGNLGMSVQDITPELAKRLDLKVSGGVIVSMLEKGGMADGAGLSRGDIILEINKSEIKNAHDYKKAIKKLKTGDSALFLILRGGNTFYRVIKIEK